MPVSGDGIVESAHAQQEFGLAENGRLAFRPILNDAIIGPQRIAIPSHGREYLCLCLDHIYRVQRIVGAELPQVLKRLVVLALLHQYGARPPLRYDGVITSPHLGIKPNSLIIFRTSIGYSAQVVECVHREFAACKHVLEIRPRRVKKFPSKIDDRHQA